MAAGLVAGLAVLAAAGLALLAGVFLAARTAGAAGGLAFLRAGALALAAAATLLLATVVLRRLPFKNLQGGSLSFPAEVKLPRVGFRAVNEGYRQSYGVVQNDNEYVKVMRLVPAGPAEKSMQLHTSDQIIGVAQGNKEMVDVIGHYHNDALNAWVEFGLLGLLAYLVLPLAMAWMVWPSCRW